MVKVKSYTRKIDGKKVEVDSYNRKKRPKGKKRIIRVNPKPSKYIIQDEYGRILGTKTRR